MRNAAHTQAGALQMFPPMLVSPASKWVMGRGA